MISLETISRRAGLVVAVCVTGLGFLPAALAQREPRVGYVYPAGGQIGTTFEVIVGGQYLNGATNVYLSGSGVRAVVAPFDPIVSPQQANELRERLQNLRKQGNLAAVLTEIRTILKKLAAFEKRRQTPALAEIVPVQITISSNAVPGNREIRLRTLTGLSNPLVFQVGQLPEYGRSELGVEEDMPLLQQIQRMREGNVRAATNAPAISVTLPATVNGQIMPGEVDRYQFAGKQGQQMVVIVSARELIPYLADAVPGWFQAKVTLFDSQGKELAFNDDYRFHPDPVLFYTIPKDGDYVLEISDSLYRGREDFVYRVAVGELPFVANFFPLGGEVGTQTTMVIWGRNLPVAQQTLNLKNAKPGRYPLTIRNKGLFSNDLPFLVDTLPECFKQQSNNSRTNAQLVTLPMIINGRVEKPGEVNVFRFDGKAGDQVVAEVYARRLDSPLDSALKLTDAAGKQIAYNDDHEDKGSGLNTHHADSYLTATLPADGTYYLYLWDAQQKGGWAYGYRLRISAPRPDFELRVVPSSIGTRPGATVPITVFAFRRDGFAGEIDIALTNAPKGFRLSGGSVPAKQDQVKLNLTVPSPPPKTPVALDLVGRAQIAGSAIVRPAVPADDMMQAFAYRHLVPAKDLLVAISGIERPRPPEKKSAKPAPATPVSKPTPPPLPVVKIPAGGTAKVQVKLPNPAYVGRLQLELEEPPPGISIKNFTLTRYGAEVVLQTDEAQVKPGNKGTLTFNAAAEITKSRSPQVKERTPLGPVPAVPFEIVPQVLSR